ncbi:MAG: YmaF family protein [Bacillota bacterium]
MGYGLTPGPVVGHVHAYRGRTSFDEGHLHRFEGISTRSVGGVDAHVHRLIGTTTFDDGHIHNYNITTGPGIPAGPGQHVHRYNGVTTLNGRPLHVHFMSGVTAPARND